MRKTFVYGDSEVIGVKNRDYIIKKEVSLFVLHPVADLDFDSVFNLSA
jgi:hypothetical protein